VKRNKLYSRQCFENAKEGQLEMYHQERRVLFNPLIKIPFKDKMKIVNGELGKEKDKARLETILF
jgi:hypothetical protein